MLTTFLEFRICNLATGQEIAFSLRPNLTVRLSSTLVAVVGGLVSGLFLAVRVGTLGTRESRSLVLEVRRAIGLALRARS